LNRLLPHQTSIKRERGEDGKFRYSSLKEEFFDFNPKILQIDPRWTNHCATVAMGTKVDSLLNIPELFQGKFLARNKSPDGGKLLRGKNIVIGNPLEGDSNGAL
jgi:hypothetical protein